MPQPPARNATASEPWRFMLRLNSILTADTSPQGLLDDLLDALQEIPEIEASWIGKPDETGLIVPQVWRGEDHASAGRIVTPDAPYSLAARTGQVIYIDDWRADPAAASRPEDTASPHWRSALVLPITAGAGPPAVLVAQSHQLEFFSRTWPPEMLAHLAALIGAGLTTRQTRLALRRTQALYRILQGGAGQLLAVRSEDKLFGQLCRLLIDSGLIVSAAIGRMDADKNWHQLATAARRNVDAMRLAASRPRPASPSLRLLAWQGRKTLVANHYASDPRFAHLHGVTGKAGIGAIAALVIPRHGRRWAVLSVSAAEEDFFDAEIVSLLERLAEMVGHRLDEFDTQAALAAERVAQAREARSGTITKLRGFKARGAGPGSRPWGLYQNQAVDAPPPRARLMLRQGALRAVFQPVLDLASGQVVSVEALARLEESGRLMLPVEFLHLLVMDDRQALFQQMLETALRQLAAWDDAGLTLSISVNVDAQILLLPDTLPYVLSCLGKSGIAPHRLVLEILETHDFLDLREARVRIERLRAIGIRVALDDLGTGYSSLLKIRELPLDAVKLDRAFIAGLRDQPDDLMFISMVQTLATTRGMTLVVEGVENADELDAMQMMGVHQVQGFLIAQPMAADSLAVWLRGQTPAVAAHEPRTLLGAYAVHLGWLRVFNFSRRHQDLLDDPRANEIFSLAHFFDGHVPVDTPPHAAYRTLNALLQAGIADRGLIAGAAAQLRASLVTALRTGRYKGEESSHFFEKK